MSHTPPHHNYRRTTHRPPPRPAAVRCPAKTCVHRTPMTADCVMKCRRLLAGLASPLQLVAT